MFLDHSLWPYSNVATLRKELRKLGITVTCRLATHHRKWMWHWESRLALPTTRNYWVSYLHGPSHCQVSCTRRSQDIIPHPFFQNKPNEPLFCVLISFDEVFQGPVDDSVPSPWPLITAHTRFHLLWFLSWEWKCTWMFYHCFGTQA